MGAELGQEDAVKPGLHPIPAPPDETAVDRRPGRAEHRGQSLPGTPEGGYEDDRGQAFSVTGPPSAATLRMSPAEPRPDLPRVEHTCRTPHNGRQVAGMPGTLPHRNKVPA